MNVLFDYCYEKLISKIPENVLAYLRMGMYFAIFMLAMLYSSCVENVHLLVKCILGVVFMGGLILFSVEKRGKARRINTVPAVLWIIVGLGQCASCIFASIEFIPMTLVWCVGFPLLFFVWDNRDDYWGMFREMSLAGNACFIIAVLLSIIFFPIKKTQYGGIFINPNGLGQWLVFALPFVLFLLDGESRPKIKRLYLCEIALILLLTCFSKSRITILAVIMMLCFYCAFSLKSKKPPAKEQIVSLAKFLLYLLVMAALTFGINRLSESVVDYCDINVYSLYDGLDNSSQGHSHRDNAYGESVTNDATLAERFKGKDKAQPTVNDYTSGRLGIWQNTISMLNIEGHPSREHIINDRNGDVGANTHNTVLQYAYDNGIITGIAFFVFICYAGLQFLIRAVRSKGASIEKYYLISFIGYFCIGMFASVNLPFLYLISFEFFLTLPILFFKNTEETDK